MTHDEKLFCDLMNAAIGNVPNALPFRMALQAATPREQACLLDFKRDKSLASQYRVSACIAAIWGRILMDAAQEVER